MKYSKYVFNKGTLGHKKHRNFFIWFTSTTVFLKSILSPHPPVENHFCTVYKLRTVVKQAPNRGPLRNGSNAEDPMGKINSCSSFYRSLLSVPPFHQTNNKNVGANCHDRKKWHNVTPEFYDCLMTLGRLNHQVKH